MVGSVICWWAGAAVALGNCEVICCWTGAFASLVAVAAVTVGAVCCEPALAGAVGAGSAGAASSLASCLAVIFTGLGTGYWEGIDPSCA